MNLRYMYGGVIVPIHDDDLYSIEKRRMEWKVFN